MNRTRTLAAVACGVLALGGCAPGDDVEDLGPDARVVVTLPPGPVPDPATERRAESSPGTGTPTPTTSPPSVELGSLFLESNVDDLSAADIQAQLAEVQDVAFGYVRARTGVEHTDLAPDAWLERTVPFVTGGHAESLRAVVDAGGGVSPGEWVDIQAGRTRRGADPQRIDLWPAERFTRTRMVVVVTYDTWTIAATDPVHRTAPGLVMDLTMVRESGRWLVDGEGEYAVSSLEWG